MDQDLSLNRSHDILSINSNFSFYKGAQNFNQNLERIPPMKLKFC